MTGCMAGHWAVGDLEQPHAKAHRGALLHRGELITQGRPRELSLTELYKSLHGQQGSSFLSLFFFPLSICPRPETPLSHLSNVRRQAISQNQFRTPQNLQDMRTWDTSHAP